MIEIEDISFSYPGEKCLFSHFNLIVQQNQSLTIIGPSGCGKTTLLYLMAGLLRPVEGEIKIKKEILNRPRPTTGLILQDYGLLPWATLKENFELGKRIRNFYGFDGIHSPLKIDERFNEVDWLEELNLKDHLNKYPSQLSGGQRQRTAIARTLTISPDLLLMDEPFSSLDKKTRENLQDLVIKLKIKYGLSLVTVTHSIEEAALLGEQILILNNPPNRKPYIVENHNNHFSNFRDSKYLKEISNEISDLLGKSE